MASLVIVVQAVSCGQTDTQTDADERFTPETLVGVSDVIDVTETVTHFTHK